MVTNGNVGVVAPLGTKNIGTPSNAAAAEANGDIGANETVGEVSNGFKAAADGNANEGIGERIIVTLVRCLRTDWMQV